MDGIVGDIPVRVGDRVAVTTLLTTVDEPGAVEAYIYVPADRARNLRLGVPVHLIDAAGRKICEFADYIYIAASGYGNADGVGEGDGGESRGEFADCAAGAGASGLGLARRDGDSDPGDYADQWRVFCVFGGERGPRARWRGRSC